MKYDIKIDYKDDSEKGVSFIFLKVDFIKEHGILTILNLESPEFISPRIPNGYKAICTFDEKRILDFHAIAVRNDKNE